MKKSHFKISLTKRFVATIAVMMVAFFCLLAGGSWTLSIFRLNDQVEKQLKLNAANKLEQIEQRLSYLVESVDAFAASSLAINSLIDASNRSSYFLDSIDDLSYTKGIRSVVAFDFSGQVIHSSSEELPAWFTMAATSVSLTTAKRTIQYHSTINAFVVTSPITYYNTPQGGIAVELNVKDILEMVLPNDDYQYIFYLKNSFLINHGQLVNSRYFALERAKDHTISASFDAKLKAILPEQIARAPIIASMVEMTFLGCLGLIISLIIARQVGYRLSLPIINLVTKVKNDIHPCSPVGTGDELEMLAESFDDNTQRLLEVNSVLEERVVQRTEQLQQQTNILQLRKKELESANKNLANAYDELKRLDKMKDEFISTVSHELRTPLTSIRGALGLLTSNRLDGKPQQQKDLLKISFSNSERLSHLINDLLDFQKLSSGMFELNLENIELKSFLKELVEGAKGYCEKYQVALNYEFTEDQHKLAISGDAFRIRQVMDNLVSNAIKYSVPGGLVTLFVEDKYPKVRICVRDHGSGIPEQYRSKIFTKFSQADASDTRAKEGTGLGLSICKGIIDAHGGHIGFEDAPGGGTIFWIELESSCSMLASSA